MPTLKMNIFLCLCLFILCFTVPSVSPLSSPDRFIGSLPSSSLGQHDFQEYLEVTRPQPSDQPNSSCSLQILSHSFGNTINSPPFSTPYSPPSDCPSPWSLVVLDFRAASKGDQYDRIAGLWLGGAELLRTSTAQPTESGIFWSVRKDITRYTSLLQMSDLNFTMMLENIVNDVYTGVYHVNVTLLYYKTNAVRVSSIQDLNQRFFTDNSGFKSEPESESETNTFGGISQITPQMEDVGEVSKLQDPLGIYESPADLIIPISDDSDSGFWFRVGREEDLHSKGIQIPPKTWRAVLELYVSFHGNDEFWYSNTPDSYIRMNNLTTGRGNGAFREVYLTVDGEIIGSEVPFPVIFTGGINPLFWEPVVGIGAFNLPSYDFEMTPFLGLLLDGKKHSFGIGVAKGISFWLVNANLHLWLDLTSSEVQANRVFHQYPALKVRRKAGFKALDGYFEVEAERKIQTSGWVQSSLGNITTTVLQNFKVKNLISFGQNGTYKVVKQQVNSKKNIKLLNDRGELITRMKIKRQYPLRLSTLTQPGLQLDRYRLDTEVYHALKEKYVSRYFSKSINNKQVSKGWMEVEDHSVLSGGANTNQSYSYRDRLNCFSRNVEATNGRIIQDVSNSACLSSA
ncbi:Peptide-N4-(N-acetyl-beta-glucosaminyl)asparagine amidase A protein [Quillaja saponaria]|uniref:Peptide-N4-(N-acetyl-beta-glucosaminyl)asparagine amidase A protein n=1 Tax=Quillaja saponaria TaxID=32244 RepID=A0AAD7PM10_QUISA|nr:Peptide-N4-(N-acetyl-beta-glucosaminyl)asparagine amidase A protein [Quillaja saponaria]